DDEAHATVPWVSHVSLRGRPRRPAVQPTIVPNSPRAAGDGPAGGEDRAGAPDAGIGTGRPAGGRPSPGSLQPGVPGAQAPAPLRPRHRRTLPPRRTGTAVPSRVRPA